MENRKNHTARNLAIISFLFGTNTALKVYWWSWAVAILFAVVILIVRHIQAAAFFAEMGW